MLCKVVLPYMYLLTLPLQLEAELIRLEELKRVSMQKFIEATRVELVKVWDQCFFGQHQRQEFSPYYEGVYICRYKQVYCVHTYVGTLLLTLQK